MEIHVKVKPRSNHNSVQKIGNELVVFLRAQPIDGAANKSLIELLSLYFKIPKTKIKVKRGVNSKYKIVELPSLDKR